MTKRFEDKIALVSGAASGMGRATAIRLAEEGASVFGIDVDAQGLAETEATIKDAGGVMSTFVVDVTSREDCFKASNAGQMGQAYTAAYCASKHALIGLSKSLAMEYLKKKVRVNVIAPGGTDTAMNVGLDIPKDVDWKLIARFSGMRGLSDPSEIAAAIAFIASDEARSVHGAVFQVDNGMIAG